MTFFMAALLCEMLGYVRLFTRHRKLIEIRPNGYTLIIFTAANVVSAILSTLAQKSLFPLAVLYLTRVVLNICFLVYIKNNIPWEKIPAWQKYTLPASFIISLLLGQFVLPIYGIVFQIGMSWITGFATAQSHYLRVTQESKIYLSCLFFANIFGALACVTSKEVFPAILYPANGIFLSTILLLTTTVWRIKPKH